MARQINSQCTSCGECVAECPNEGIIVSGFTYVIDENRCTECYGFYPSARCEEVCPVEAIEPVSYRVREDDVAMLAAFLRPDRFPRD